MTNLTLIIPAKNEKESLPKVLELLKKSNYDVIVSLKKDDLETINSIKKFNIKIYEQKGSGYGNSLIEGIKQCKTKFFCIFNADGSFEINDFVFASRYLKGAGSDDDTITTYIGNKIFSFLGKILFSLDLSDILYTFVMGNTFKFKELDIKSNDFRFCVEFPIKIKIFGMSYTSLPSYEKKRIAGKKKVNAFKDGFLILLEMIKLFIIFKIFKKNKVR